MKPVFVILTLQAFGALLSVILTLQNPLSAAACWTGIYGLLASGASVTGLLLWASHAAYVGWTKKWPDRFWAVLVGATVLSGGLGLIYFTAVVRCSV